LTLQDSDKGVFPKEGSTILAGGTYNKILNIQSDGEGGLTQILL